MSQSPKPVDRNTSLSHATNAHNELGPRIFLGGIFLSALAGFIDVTLINALQTPVSHLTGSVAKMSISLTEARLSDFQQIFLVVASFLAGTIISSAVLGKLSGKKTANFGLMLFIQGFILGLAAADLSRGGHAGLLLAALACGIQNAMSHAYCGLSLKTTHVTGMITDIGILLGNWIRDRQSDLRKLALLTALILGFVFGGSCAAMIYSQYRLDALWLASFSSATIGFSYWLYRFAQHSHVRPFVCIDNPQCPYPSVHSQLQIARFLPA